MELTVISPDNKKEQKVTVSDDVFARPFNNTLVHQVVTSYLANGRQGSKAQKSRSEVRGGGAKPWRQKGTGRARAGTTRSPIWVGGGRAFAAKPRDYSQKTNKKMYVNAMRSILSKLIQDNRLVVVDDFGLTSHKTKDLATKLNALEAKRALIICEAIDQNLYYAARNLVGINVVDTHTLDPVSLLNYDKIMVTLPALKVLEEKYS
ncbi:MAG: 50S ribosomal protein L4 [Gammaproteobacteria bacterium]